MSSTRLKELPPSVVDEFVNMQLKKTYRSSIDSDTSMIDSPTPSRYKVEYRLIKKRKGPRSQSDDLMNQSPSSLRYVSPIPQKTPLGPIAQETSQSPQPQSDVVPVSRNRLKTPELIRLSVERLGSVGSIMYPLRASTDSDMYPKPLPPIEPSPVQRQPVVNHNFVCPQCKCNIMKDLFITITDNAGAPVAILQQRSADERAASNTGSITMGTQTDEAETVDVNNEKSNENVDVEESVEEPEEKAKTPPVPPVSTDDTENSTCNAVEDEPSEQPKPETAVAVENTDQTQAENESKPEATEVVEDTEKTQTVEVVVGDTEKADAEDKGEHPIPVEVVVEDADKTRLAEEGDEPLNVIQLVGDDLKLIERCRAIVKSADENGSTEQIQEAIQQLAVIAQQQLTPSQDGNNSIAMQHNRLVCGKIGDVVAEESFHLRLFQILHGFTNGWDFFSGEENYHTTLNLFTDLTSFLMSSIRLPSNLLEDTNFLSQILLILSYKKYINELTKKNVWRLFDACLTILSHLARDSSISDLLHAQGAVTSSKKFLSTSELGYAGLWLPATVVMARIASQEEIAAAIKGKTVDFIPQLTGFIMSYFEDKTGGGDETSRTISLDRANDDTSSLASATVMMPMGAAVRLVDAAAAFVHFVSAIVAKNERSSDPDFQLTQSELDDLVECSIFLIELPRPSKGEESELDLSLAEWRQLVKHGLELVPMAHELTKLLKLTLGDRLRDDLSSALTDFIGCEWKEGTLKRQAASVHAALFEEHQPTPVPRSVTATIEQGSKPTGGIVSPPNVDEERKATTTPETSRTEPVSIKAPDVGDDGVPQWANAQVRSWMRSVGLEQFEDRFEDYDGSMLLALDEVRRESPSYFQREMATKLDDKIDNLVRFTAELTKLAVPYHQQNSSTSAVPSHQATMTPSGV